MKIELIEGIRSNPRLKSRLGDLFERPAHMIRDSDATSKKESKNK
ncbi:MAG TPA: hypothetical protein VE641_19675 [Chthoniobacterales bacterium]|jgi:hypothetical protein|nr:hypothetical protein [Chthoniobacterales bacterium]